MPLRGLINDKMSGSSFQSNFFTLPGEAGSCTLLPMRSLVSRAITYLGLCSLSDLMIEESFGFASEFPVSLH